MLVPTIEPEDMDATAMLRRAHERGEQLGTYDVDRLLMEVRELLQARGLHPDLPEGSGRHGMATGAAGALLRAFGILPTSDWQVRDRVNAPDPDER